MPSTPFETLIQACKDGNLAKVTQVVIRGAELNKKSPDDETPLFVAVQNNHKPVVEYLLSKGARIDEKNGQNGQVITQTQAANQMWDQEIAIALISDQFE